jgi:DNA-binding XRE family transcriptional regulator
MGDVLQVAMEYDFDWAGWIKFERLLRGWSQNQMAKKAIISGWQSSLNRIEAKKMGVTLRTLVIVAPIFGFSPSEILDSAFVPFIEPTNQDNIDFLGVSKLIRSKRESLGYTEEELMEKSSKHRTID